MDEQGNASICLAEVFVLFVIYFMYYYFIYYLFIYLFIH